MSRPRSRFSTTPPLEIEGTSPSEVTKDDKFHQVARSSRGSLHAIDAVQPRDAVAPRDDEAQATVIVMPHDLAADAPPASGRGGAEGATPLLRRAIAIEAVVTTSDGRRFAFETVNVSPRGLFVSGNTRAVVLQRGGHYTLTLRAAHRSTSFKAQLVHVVHPGEDGGQRPGYGFRITLITREERMALERILLETPTRDDLAARRRVRRILGAVAVAVGLAGVGAASLAAVTAAGRPRVEVARSQRRPVDEIVESATGEIVPHRFMTLRSSATSATQFEIAVQVGERIAAGQVLARPGDARITEARAAAEERAAAADAHLRRVRQQADHDPTVGDELAHATAAAQRARAALDARIEDARRSEVRAPFDGFVAGLDVQSGDVVQPMAAIGEIVDASSMHASVPFSEADVARIKAGMSARVVVPGVELDGTIDGIGAVVRSFGAAKAVLVEVALGAASDVRPGASARVQVVVGQHDGVVVPPDAVVGEPPQERIWTVDSGAVARRHAVKVAPHENGAAAVEILAIDGPGGGGMPPDVDVIRHPDESVLASRDHVKIVR